MLETNPKTTTSLRVNVGNALNVTAVPGKVQISSLLGLNVSDNKAGAAASGSFLAIPLAAWYIFSDSDHQKTAGKNIAEISSLGFNISFPGAFRLFLLHGKGHLEKVASVLSAPVSYLSAIAIDKPKESIESFLFTEASEASGGADVTHSYFYVPAKPQISIRVADTSADSADSAVDLWLIVCPMFNGPAQSLAGSSFKLVVTMTYNDGWGDADTKDDYRLSDWLTGRKFPTDDLSAWARHSRAQAAAAIGDTLTVQGKRKRAQFAEVEFDLKGKDMEATRVVLKSKKK
jgi:hypothetical protein